MNHRLLLAVLIAAATAAAGEAAALDLHRQYEDDLVQWALGAAHLERDPSPAGKVIERVEIVREEIIAASDPWPNFVNWFHVKTKDYVVRQELLIGPGEVWDEQRIEESARNLRKLWILAVVRTAACKSQRPGHVILLVVTKDLWSIRLNTNWSMIGSVLHFMDLTPTEMNFLGRNKRVSLHLGLQEVDLSPIAVRDRLEFGELYIDERLLGSRWRLMEYFDLRIAGDVPGGGLDPQGHVWQPQVHEGDLDGIYAYVRLQRPLYSLATEWAFDSYFVADYAEVRRFVVNSGQPTPGETRGLSLDTVAITPPTGETSYVPRVYDREQLYATASLTRSFGRGIKHNLTTGLTAYSYDFRPPAGFPFDEAVRQAYVFSSLPRSETAAFLALNYRTYDTRFLQLRNVQTFALTEDYAVGHDLQLEARFANNLRQADQGFLTLRFQGRYQWYLRDDLLMLWVDAGTRWQPSIDLPLVDAPWVNSYVSGGLKNITPRLWIGRLHLQAQAILRKDDLDHTTSTLGGDTGLRGYARDQFEGDNALQVNAEYRSNPINLFTLHLGFVLFYDGGAVFGGPDPRRPSEELAFHYYQSVGLGLRTHFPQFDKESLRVDFGVPLSGYAGGLGTWFSFSFRQVF